MCQVHLLLLQKKIHKCLIKFAHCGLKLILLLVSTLHFYALYKPTN
jgi:hypothetical protein